MKIVLVVLGCVAGKMVMTQLLNTWFGFNGSAHGIPGVAEHFGDEKKIVKKWGE